VRSPFTLRLPLAWLQLRRQWVRTLVGVAGVAFAVTLILMQLGFHRALFASAVRVHDTLRTDLVLVSPQAEFLARMQPFPRPRLHQAMGHADVIGVSPVYTGLAIWKNLKTRGTRVIFVMGIDVGDDAISLLDGRVDMAKLQQPDVILFDEGSRPEFGPVAAAWRAGEPIAVELANRRVEVVGLFSLGTSFGIDGTVLTSDQNFLRIFRQRERGQIDIGLIRLRSGADPQQVRDEIAARLPEDVEVLTKAQYIARERHYWATSTPIGYVFTFGVIMGLVVGGIIVYQILFADIAEHLSEYATLKAMGYANGYLVWVVLQEACILAVLGFLPGVLVCAQLYRLTEAATRLPLRLSLSVGAFVLALTLVMCCVSAALALRKVRSADPAEVF
jgi:putative ABC transport system permease protein